MCHSLLLEPDIQADRIGTLQRVGRSTGSSGFRIAPGVGGKGEEVVARKRQLELADAKPMLEPFALEVVAERNSLDTKILGILLIKVFS